MAPQQRPRSHNRKKIEPLNWAEAAQSPALKGMLSFLDITPEAIRSGHYPDIVRVATSEPLPDSGPLPDSSLPAAPSGGSREDIPDSESLPDGDTLPDSDIRSDSETISGSESLPDSQTLPGSESHLTVPTGQVAIIVAASESHPDSEPLSASVSLPGSVSLPDASIVPGSESHADHNALSDNVKATVTEPQPDSVSLPGSVSSPSVPEAEADRNSVPRRNIALGATASQNRKIRKCRLAQDAHSPNEEMVYRILWEAGKPLTTNPLGSREVRIGLGELAAKARLHKTNIRVHVRSLIAKLAVEQIGSEIGYDAVARTYRVFSYKEILDHRKDAGLEYVIRRKSVDFVTADGTPIPLKGLPTNNTKKPSGGKASHLPGSESLPDSVTQPDSESSARETQGVILDLDHLAVSQAMNKYGMVDDAATRQLILACRKVRPDAMADEIAFFADEKMYLALNNRKITNPIGLILATVPQCFLGYAFEEFRRRNQERKRLAEEEAERKRLDEIAMDEWLRRGAEKTLSNSKATEKEKREAEETLTYLANKQTK